MFVKSDREDKLFRTHHKSPYRSAATKLTGTHTWVQHSSNHQLFGYLCIRNDHGKRPLAVLDRHTSRPVPPRFGKQILFSVPLCIQCTVRKILPHGETGNIRVPVTALLDRSSVMFRASNEGYPSSIGHLKCKLMDDSWLMTYTIIRSFHWNDLIKCVEMSVLTSLRPYKNNSVFFLLSFHWAGRLFLNFIWWCKTLVRRIARLLDCHMWPRNFLIVSSEKWPQRPFGAIIPYWKMYNNSAPNLLASERLSDDVIYHCAYRQAEKSEYHLHTTITTEILSWITSSQQQREHTRWTWNDAIIA